MKEDEQTKDEKTKDVHQQEDYPCRVGQSDRDNLDQGEMSDEDYREQNYREYMLMLRILGYEPYDI